MKNKIIKFIILSIFCLIAYSLQVEAKTPDNSGNNFLLPKTFKINEKLLPPLDTKSKQQQNKSVTKSIISENKSNNTSTTNTVNTNVNAKEKKSSVTVNSTPVKKETLVIYKQPSSTVIKTSNQPSIKQSLIKENQKVVPSSITSVPKTIIKTNPAISVIKPNNTLSAASLSNLVKNYEYSYEDTLKSTLMALSESGIVPVSYNTERGQIVAKFASGKEIFVLLVPFSENFTCVRITPNDGNYYLPMSTINQIFSSIDINLHST